MPGSIRQRGPKVWQVRVSLGKDPETGRYGYAQRYVNRDKRDAQRAHRCRWTGELEPVTHNFGRWLVSR